MKKLFLLLMIAIFAVTVNAQGMYTGGSGTEVKMVTQPNDSLFIEGRYVGVILEAVKTTGVGTEAYTEYKIALDEFPINSLKDKIAASLGAHDQQIDYIERFRGKTKAQISGYYLRRAGELKNGRNNWVLFGAAVITAGAIIFPPSLGLGVAAINASGIVLSSIGIITNTVACVKDYKANKMLKKAGDVLME